MKIDLFDDRFKETRAECLRCPARGGKYVRPQIRQESNLTLVGERPGAKEAEQGEVFVGSAGGTLDRLLAQAGSHRELVSVGNSVMCFAVGNPEPTAEEIECCSGVLEELLEQTQAKVVVALGRIAGRRLTGKETVVNWRGSLLHSPERVLVGEKVVLGPAVFKSGPRKGQEKPRKEKVWVEQRGGRQVVITLHPAELLYTGFASFPMVVADLRRARKVSDGEQLIQVGGLITGKVSDARRLALLLEAHDEITIDTETDSLGGRVNLIGVSVGPDHGESFYPNADVLGPLRSWLGGDGRGARRTVVGHNLSYDYKVLEKAIGEGFRIEAKPWDTMHAAHFERPDLPETLRPKALDSVASRLPEIWYWNWKQDFRDKTDPNGVRYNQLDCAFTTAIKVQLKGRLAASGRLKHFEGALMEVLPRLIKMEAEGVRVDKEKLGELSLEQAGIFQRLNTEWKSRVPEGLNSRSPKQLMDYFYRELGLPIQKQGRGAKETQTLDHDALEKLAKIAPDSPAKVLFQLRHVEKVIANYLDLGLDLEGRLHPQYNLSGTVFGRLSSGGDEGFNFQNIPRIGEGCPRGIEGCVCVRLRELFVCDDGDRGIAVGDWSQIEYRLVALLGGEEWLIRELRDPKFDLHGDTARKLGVSRDIGKRVNHAANYGAGAFKLSVVTKRPQLECASFLEIMRRDRPSITRWQRDVVSKVKRDGWVSNPFGRRGIFRVGRDGEIDVPKVLAFLAQSTAADMMLVAINRADNAGLRLRWTVHDELGISLKYEDDRLRLNEVMEDGYEELGGFSNPVDLGEGRNWAEAKMMH